MCIRDRPIIEDADYMKTEDAVQFADMAVVLGGDGTLSLIHI